jgi:anti-anti-sigma regulatory factor
MSAASATILVSAADLSAWIQISGRANFASSVDFKTLVNGLHEDGCQRFALDLTNCVLMDSTFLGVLAGFGMRMDEANGHSAEHPIELLNPNARISELLENLGVSHIFKIVSGPAYTPAAPTVEALSAKATPEEITRTCLEAHQTLMSIDPENIPRFKDVAQFLAEDLKKHKDKGNL